MKSFSHFTPSTSHSRETCAAILFLKCAPEPSPAAWSGPHASLVWCGNKSCTPA